MKFTTFRNWIISILLVILGGVVGFQLGRTGKLPFNLEIPIMGLAQKARVPSLSLIEGETTTPSNVPVDFSVFWEVWGFLDRDYLETDKLDPQKMLDGAVYGLTASLGDPYTVYLPPDNNKRSGEDLAGSFYGVGIELGYIEGILAVVAPLKDNPADKAGVQAGDLILHVKDEKNGVDDDTTNWSLDTAVNKIRGPKGDPVTLTLWRRDNGQQEPFDIEIIRDQIIVETVEVEFIEHQQKRVAHLRITRFGERTLGEWNDAVSKILAQKDSISGIVLDFRNNPGGFFDRSIEIASDFFDKGVVVTQKNRYTSQDFQAKGKARLKDIPLVVLVNKGSASASEIVAGALRDQVNAKLVGEKTFGKGTVQDRRELSNTGGIHITVGRWLLPKGDWIHHEGIPVDVEIKDDRETEEDEQLLKAIEEL